jgi:hypothetical protein
VATDVLPYFEQVLVISDLNSVTLVIRTEFGVLGFAEEDFKRAEPAKFFIAEERPVQPVIQPVPPRAAVRTEQLQLIETAVAEEGRQLYVVRVKADGTEVERRDYPLDMLNNIADLLEKYKSPDIDNGTYRVYLEEEGAPRQLVTEFRKSGQEIGEQKREPGRGSNPREDLGDGAQLFSAESDAVAQSQTERIDEAFERFGNFDSAADTPPQQERPDVGPESDPAPPAADHQAAAEAVPAEIAPSVMWRPHVAFHWATVVAVGLAAGARRNWDEQVDEALEESDDRVWRQAIRWVSRLRNRTPH